MPSRILSDREVEQLASWPQEVARSDLAAFFTLSLEDLRWVRSFRSPRAAPDRLGLAVQLCALPFLGFIPAELRATPAEVVERLAKRIGVPPRELARYVELVSDRSRREHAQAVIARAGWRTCGPGEWRALGDWLLMRALEHDTQSVLFAQALDHLQAEKIARPGPDRLMRAVATARAAATREIHRRLEHRRNLYAAILAQACNYGTSRMAELTGISVDTLDWTTQWYLREDTLRPANADMINAHHRHALAAALGGGTLSSSDGLRLPMRGKSLTARALSRYFVDEGVTSYTHVSDQYTTFGTQIIVSTERDATYTLDEILGNTSELAIFEHATDSHGQTLATFAMFDAVGLRLSPRIAKLTEKRLWRPHAASHYERWPLAGPLLKHHAQIDLIDESWDDLCRIGASLKLGYVSAALLIAKLQAGSRQHPLAKAMLEYGKLLRTVHALRWFTDEAFRRRIGRQLNLGESLNDLRRFIFFAHRGKVRYPRHDDQTTQAHCHSLVVNACVLSITGYLEDAIAAQRAAGHPVSDEAISHLSPGHYEPINPYGTLNFDIANVVKRPRRPLRRL